MKHIFIQGEKSQPVFVLLHGTGGSEESLIDVGNKLNSKASLLGIKGEVNEQGMARYFRRLREGVYDEVDLYEKGMLLNQFIKQASSEYHFSLNEVVLVGYSNGANIGLHLLLNEASVYRQAILFHPMYPLSQIKEVALSKTKAFISFGINDPIVPLEESQHVIDILRNRQASVEIFETIGHNLSLEEIEAAKNWLQKEV